MANQTVVNVNGLIELSKVKAAILDAVDVLVNDQMISKEEVACDLLGLVEKVSRIEGDMEKQVIAKDYRKLYILAEQKELEREQKNTSTVQE